MSLMLPTTSTSLSYIVIPSDESKTIQCLRMDGHEMVEAVVADLLGPSVKLSLLLRPCDTIAGLYVYSSATVTNPNIRATRLSMACGHLSLRFMGDVLLLRSTMTNDNLMFHEIRGAAMISHDLRNDIQLELGNFNHDIIPDWLGNASQQNYHDSVVMAQFAAAMSTTMMIHSHKNDTDNNNDRSDSSEPETTGKELLVNATGIQHVAARTSLCLHCRRPADTLCSGCNSAYFCLPPRACQQLSWSHACMCLTWNQYSARRTELSTFPFDEWHQQLLRRDCQQSDQPYRTFLQDTIGIANDSWWRTEIDGWAGGDSASAITVDIHTRRSYQHGFAPVTECPPERHLTDMERNKSKLICNSCGILKVPSWKEYYQLRGIPFSSPIALLLTFPLTIYYSIVEYGEVPITVARMLKRPLRIHVVGIEKELNFIDLFKEIGFLLPEDTKVCVEKRYQYNVSCQSYATDSLLFQHQNVCQLRSNWFSLYGMTCCLQVVEANH